MHSLPSFPQSYHHGTTRHRLVIPQGTSPEAAAHAAKVTAVVDKHLLTETFLAGQRITIADIAVFCGMEAVGEVEGGASLTPAIKRWMGTCRNQPQFL